MAKKTQQQREDAANSYGWMLAVLQSDPELARLLDRSIDGSYDQRRFVAELRDTKWYKTHSEAYRQAIVLQKADPAEFTRRQKQSLATVSEMYYQLTGRRAPAGILGKMASQAFMYGFNENEVRDMIGRSFNTSNLMRYGNLGGTLGDAERQLRQAAEDYGMPFSETAIARQLNNIATQQQDVTSTIAYYRKAAMTKYAGFADELRAGMTVKDIAEPYKQLMAKTLEISDRGISVNDAFIQKALTFRPTQGKKPGPPTGMPLWEFEKQLKNDPRWNKTQNAQAQVMEVGRAVLQDMGLIGGGS